MMEKLWNTRTGASKRRRRLVPVVAILALGFAGMGTGSAGAATRSLPFASLVSGSVSGPNASGAFSLKAIGIATQLGTVTYAGSGQVTGNVNGVLIDTLTETLTATNGDTLTVLCHQTANPKGPGVYDARDQWTVIGGTGRFRSASGSGVGITHIDLNVHTFTKASIGAIAS
jgi:hypothetical protein